MLADAWLQSLSGVAWAPTDLWVALHVGDPGADYFTRRIPAKTKARAISQLEALGYRVSLQPLTDTA